MKFTEALKTKDFVVTSHVNLAEVQDVAALQQQAEILRPAVDGIHLTEGTMAHMSGLAAAALLLPKEVDPIIHISCRDRNRIGLQKELIGAAVLGVSSVMISRGAKIPKSVETGVRNVFDTNALDLMTYIKGLKEGDDDVFNSDFLVGVNAVAFAPADDWEPKNLIRKCDAGANFVQLQPCFDMDAARTYMARIVASKLTHRVSFVVALTSLPSAEVARWVRDNVKGALVPESVIDRLETASDPEQEGIDICAELLKEFSTIPGVSGADLLNLGSVEAVVAAIDASGVRTS